MSSRLPCSSLLAAGLAALTGAAGTVQAADGPRASRVPGPNVIRVVPAGTSLAAQTQQTREAHSAQRSAHRPTFRVVARTNSTPASRPVTTAASSQPSVPPAVLSADRDARIASARQHAAPRNSVASSSAQRRIAIVSGNSTLASRTARPAETAPASAPAASSSSPAFRQPAAVPAPNARPLSTPTQQRGPVIRVNQEDRAAPVPQVPGSSVQAKPSDQPTVTMSSAMLREGRSVGKSSIDMAKGRQITRISRAVSSPQTLASVTIVRASQITR